MIKLRPEALSQMDLYTAAAIVSVIKPLNTRADLIDVVNRLDGRCRFCVI